MPRAVLIVLDSVGIGGAEDAGHYGDAGADTVGHIAVACAEGRGDRAGLRSGPLRLPTLVTLGLLEAAEASSGRRAPVADAGDARRGRWGYGVEVSNGKDTPSGHWEMLGCPVTFDWGYFPPDEPSFPKPLTDALIARCGLPGILGNRHAPGPAIIRELGEAHIRTGRPIVYTSADSVFQVAAHEAAFGLDRLYDVCEVARELCDPLNIGRVIARPFVGDGPDSFERTGNRRDYAVPPPGPTLFDRLADAGRPVISVGKIADIFAHRGTGEAVKATGNPALIDATLAAVDRLPDGGFAMVNLIDFDMLYGHPRDVPGYAAALEAFDRRLPGFLARLGPGDLLVVTADHGNDPTAPGSDHTREHVPILTAGGPDGPPPGRRETFADIGQSVARHLGVAALPAGTSWI